jgi:SAM-dependent methyltransferase
MNKTILTQHLRHPKSRREIIQDVCRGKSVLDIGCVHHAIENSSSAGWLHGNVVEVAGSVLGVDYLDAEVGALARRGYNVITGDVNFPLPIERRFDVIVVGNLIEHLSSFSGLMENINRLLMDDGVALISTANPFFREQYFYSALKNDIIVNPEHTCWIDPVTLDQLSRRFGLATAEVMWVKEKWNLSDAYFNGKDQSLDTFTGRWSFSSSPSLLESLVTPLLTTVFRAAVNEDRRKRIQARYHDEVGRMLYLKLKGVFLEIWWRFRRLSIPSSAINEHELFVSVLKRARLG